jgi:hypothetical protein
MRTRIRAGLAALLFAPALATCGGDGGGSTGPTAAVPEKLGVVTPPPASVANGQAFGAIVQLRTNAGAAVAEAGVVVHVAVVEAATPLYGPVDVATGADGRAVFTGLSLAGLVGTRHLTFTSAGLTETGATLALGAGPAATLTKVSGDSQTTTVGEAVPAAVVVKVLDAYGNAVTGATVRAQVAEGNGTVGGGSQVDHVTAGSGLASFADWTLGGTVGANRLDLLLPTAAGAGTLHFYATGQAGPPANVEFATSWPYSFPIDTLLTTPVTATVTDVGGNPVGGRPVRFWANDSAVADADTITDSLGQARLHSIRAPTTAGGWSIILKIPGSSTSGATGFYLQAGPPARIERLSDSSSLIPRSRNIELFAKVWDGFGNPAGNKEMQWSIVSGPGTLGPIYPVTDGGVSHAVFNPAGAGRTVIRAFATLLPDSVAEFIVDVVAPVALVATAGDSQVVTAGDTLPTPLRVRVVDSAGLGVAGVPVHFDDTPVDLTVTADSAGFVDAPGIVSRATVDPYTLRAQSAWIQDSVATWIVLPHAGPATELVRLLQDVNQTPSGEVGEVIPVPPGVKLRDRLGLPVMTGVIHFTPQEGSLSVDSALIDSVTGLAYPQGWTLDTLVGEQHLTATMGALAPLELLANALPGPVASLTPLAGHGIEGFVGEQVAYGVRVEARDRYGNLAAGRDYSTSGAGGGATGTGMGGTFDAAGRAYVDGWILGSVGSGNTVRILAGTDTLDQPALGVAVSPFDIQLRNVPAAYQQVFRAAAYQWRRRITADVPDVTVNIGGGQCAEFQGALSGTVDDLVIDVSIGPIDGPGAILGGATPCFIRTADSIPILGVMQFDDADLALLESQGTLGDVILHEMGHVLGIGSLWNYEGLLLVPGTSNVQYLGAGGKEGYAALGGGAGNVPVENTGGQGTADSHWRETVMPSELMTGYLSAQVNPMSVVTVKSLTDLGYTVDPSLADAYTLGAAPSVEPGRPGVRIQDRVRPPTFRVDPDGAIHRIE